MKDVIISKKAKEKKMLLGNIANITILAKMARISGFIDLAKRYN